MSASAIPSIAFYGSANSNFGYRPLANNPRRARSLHPEDANQGGHHALLPHIWRTMAWLGIARGLWTSVILSSYAAGTTVRGDSSTAISGVQYGRNVVADSRSLQSRPYWLQEKVKPERPRAGEEQSRQSQTRVGRSVEFWRRMSLLCLAAWFHSLLRSLMNRHDLLNSVETPAVPYGTCHASRRRLRPPSRLTPRKRRGDQRARGQLSGLQRAFTKSKLCATGICLAQLRGVHAPCRAHPHNVLP